MSHIDSTPPPLVSEPGWTPLHPLPEVEAARSFVSGEHQARFRVAYFRRETDRHLMARAWFGPDAEGPPGHAHGGAVAAVLDEALGAAAWAEGHPIVVARLITDFRQMVPLGTDATVEAWVHKVDGRKVYTHATLIDAAGTLLAEGQAICVRLSPGHLETFRKVRESRRRSAAPHLQAPTSG